MLIPTTKLTITRVKSGAFKNDEDETIQYWWYKGLRTDGITVEFGSPNEYEKGQEVEILLEKSELPGGRFRYKEVRED